MHKITNKTPHPFDVQTKSGLKVISACGTLQAEFDPAYLELIRLSFDVEELQAEEQEQEELPGGEQQDEADDAGTDESADSAEVDSEKTVDPPEEAANEPELEISPAERYHAITGKKPDGRWSEDRLAAEIEKLSK